MSPMSLCHIHGMLTPFPRATKRTGLANVLPLTHIGASMQADTPLRNGGSGRRRALLDGGLHVNSISQLISTESQK